MNALKTKNYYLYFLVGFLILLGGGFTLYQYLVLEMPLKENKETFIWSVETMIKFHAKEGMPIKVKLEIPTLESTDFVRLRENFISRHYGYTVQPENNKRYVIWSIRRAKGMQTLYYKLNIYKYDNNTKLDKNLEQELPIVQQSLLTNIPDAEKLTMEELLDSIRSHSSDVSTFTVNTIQASNDFINKKAHSFLERKPEKIAKYIVQLLAMANIPAKVVYAVELKEGNNIYPTIWIKSFNGEKWLYFNITTGTEGLPDNILPWGTDFSMLNIEGGYQQKIRFSITREITNAMNLALDMGEKLRFKAIDFSLFSLPLHIQHVYRVLFLVPIGVFIILLLRIFIGLETIGTFMPVLIALAFRDTQLIGGIILFAVITIIGLLLRANLEQIKLLIVPKLSVILTAVIILIAIISIISNKLDIECGLSIALFPMVILTMTIERLSILWEERDGASVIKIGLSSLFAASMAYLIMSISWVHYVFFAFPGLLLILMAIMLLCGRYRGYRLLELLRFKEFLF
jgi:hypothetical protein